jgi:hypothetical protein
MPMSVVNRIKKWWNDLVKMMAIGGQEPDANYFSEAECATLHRLQDDARSERLDDQTWADLSIKGYFDLVTERCSIFGKQVIYRWLRIGQDEDTLATSKESVKTLMADPVARGQLHAAFAPLRRTEIEIASFVVGNGADVAIPRWLRLAYAIPPVMIIAILNTLFTPVPMAATIGFVVAVALLLVLFALHMRYDDTIRLWDAHLAGVMQMLAAILAVGALDESRYSGFSALSRTARKLLKKLTRWPVPIGLLKDIRDYLDWFWLGKVHHYFKQAKQIQKHRAFLREAFHLCGEWEAICAIARHLAGRNDHNWAATGTSGEIVLRDVVHPLLPTAHPLTVQTHGRGTFLSGQNGIGKSTLLRIIGLNAVTARAFGFCYASQAIMPRLGVRTSIQNNDSLLEGESLYIAELRRARELLQERRAASPQLYLIDEIFRGTNYLESVAAAASFLERLADKGIVIVSSHNLVLATLLAAKYDPRHLDHDPATHALILKEGVLARTNGISLLKAHGFDDALESNAVKVFEWLNQYLAHPSEGADVLAASPQAA